MTREVELWAAAECCLLSYQPRFKHVLAKFRQDFIFRISECRNQILGSKSWLEPAKIVLTGTVLRTNTGNLLFDSKLEPDADICNSIVHLI